MDWLYRDDSREWGDLDGNRNTKSIESDRVARNPLSSLWEDDKTRFESPSSHDLLRWDTRDRVAPPPPPRIAFDTDRQDRARRRRAVQPALPRDVHIHIPEGWRRAKGRSPTKASTSAPWIEFLAIAIPTSTRATRRRTSGLRSTTGSARRAACPSTRPSVSPKSGDTVRGRKNSNSSDWLVRPMSPSRPADRCPCSRRRLSSRL